MTKHRRSGGRHAERSGWVYLFGGLAAAVIILFVVVPIAVIVLGPLFAIWFQPPVVPCKLEVWTKEDRSEATVDIAVDLYTNDAAYSSPGGRTIQHPLYGLLYAAESATASSGKASFAATFHSYMTVYLQARQAAPASADPYLTPLRPFVIGRVDTANDVVSLGNLWVRDVSGTAPTFTCVDQTGNTIDDTTAHFINTTDTSITFTFSALDDDTWYGVECADGIVTLQGLPIAVGIDWQTGYQYQNILYWKGAKIQDITTPHLTFSDPTNIYYVFILTPFADDLTVTDDDTMKFTIGFGSAPVADTSVTLDAFDVQRFDTLSNLVFSGKLNPTALSTKVA